jgi:hypothetical protein
MTFDEWTSGFSPQPPPATNCDMNKTELRTFSLSFVDGRGHDVR